MLITLFQYNSYYLRVQDDAEAGPIAYAIDLVKQHIPTGKAFLGNLLKRHLHVACQDAEQFIALEDGQLFIIGSLSEFSFPVLLSVRINEDRLKHTALSVFNKWHDSLQRELINTLLLVPRSLKDPLITCSRYSHSDAHSLWIFNPYTEVFTRAASSHEYGKTFLTRNDKSTLYEFLESKLESESREPKQELCLHTSLSKCRTLNRLRIPLDDTGTIAVLNLYSFYPKYTIPESIVRIVKELITSKYAESRIELHKNYENIEQLFTTDYRLGELETFLRTLTLKITEHLSFECCSIFATDRPLKRLRLVATTDSQRSAASIDNIFYSIDEDSLTGRVAFTKKRQVSYDLTSDFRNSKKYSEMSILPGKNWIGVPILVDSTLAGVIRVKNKYTPKDDTRELRNIRPADIEYLESIATMVASLMTIDDLYCKSRDDLKKSQDRIQAQNEFNTVFLHEVKTPISTFSLAPYAIKRRIEFIRNVVKSMPAGRDFLPGLQPILLDHIDRIELRLADISVMGDRLKFIADTYFFDLIIAKNEPQHLKVLQDVVFPVVNITKEYFKREYEFDLKVDVPSFEKLRIYGDQTMLTLVLNALIDNAGKYTLESHRPVVVSGRLDSEENVAIIVSNYGLPIDADEAETVFEKGERGRNPKALNISGTGIGLHLGRRIMREQKGDLRLLQRADPVRFAMILPGDL